MGFVVGFILLAYLLLCLYVAIEIKLFLVWHRVNYEFDTACDTFDAMFEND